MRMWHRLCQHPVFREICGLILFAVVHLNVAAQQEVPIFKMTGYEGHVSAAFQSDGSTTVTPSVDSTDSSMRTQKQSDLRLETSLMTHSYVYHPKFMALDVGLGVVSADSVFETDNFASQAREPLYNLSVHASVLPEKPFHGTFFYDQINSAPALGAGESYNQQNHKYGFTLALMAPLSPVDMDMDVTREDNKGTGSTRFTDEKTNRLNINARRALGSYGSVQASYQAMGQVSNSGVSGLPFQESQQDGQSLSFDTRLKLGVERNLEFNNHIEYSTQNFVFAQGRAPDISDLRFSLDYRGHHEPNWTSYANYQIARNQQDELFMSTDSASGGVAWTVSNFFDVSASVRNSNTRASHMSSTDSGMDGSARYERPLPIGTGTVSYGLRYSQHGQTATAAQTAVVGEHIFFTGTASVSLGRIHVSPGSVMVHNLARTQTYVQDIDYSVTVVGNTTQLRRLISGSILDGEEVLVDYAVDIGGTYSSTQVDQSLGFTWTLSRMFDVYVRFADSIPTVTAGEPTTPLSAVKVRWYGLHSSVPLSASYDLTANGNLEREVHEDSIAPFVRTSADLYLRGELPVALNNSYQLGVRRLRIDAQNLAQSVDQTDYELTLAAQLSNGLTVSTAAMFQRDSGGTEIRDSKTLTLRAMWRFRRVSASADLARTSETQGLYSRSRTVGRVFLRRDF